MKTNLKTNIIGNKVILVPYRSIHVPRYHTWMQSEELQQLTASEPLSLEEEYNMQKSWAQDENKCTFIVLDAESFNVKRDEIEAMIGDVNLFFNDPDNMRCAELEIMIAETRCRGKGMGKEAVLLMMAYGLKHLDVEKYTCKIGLNNRPSLLMFEKFGFKETSRSDVFQEITLELSLTEEVIMWLEGLTSHMVVEQRT